VKLLITGSNGFLGSAFVRRLLERGEADVRALVRPGSNRSKLEPLIAKYGDALEIFTGTLNKADDCVAALEGVDVLYHLAASPGGAPADMFLNSVIGTRNLLDAMVASDRKIKLVFCSSFGVYGVAPLRRGAMVDEQAPLEQEPERRDVYSHTKLRQEQLCFEYQKKHGFPMTTLRPGVIYGPGGGAISARVGLKLFGIFLHLGRRTTLPLTFVDNCAEALAVAGTNDAAIGEIFNVVDDDLLSARAYLKKYQKHVSRMPVVSFPYFATKLMSRAVEAYSKHSQGQLPAIFTPYKTESMWKGNTFSNEKLKSIGWQQLVSTSDGLDRHFAALRAQ
jgi:nucleoside-diphosphate-sugar epimerase